MPTSVMPTWTVERNAAGWLASSSAARARSSPSSARCCKRTLRAATTAISDMAKTALARMSARMMRNSVAMGRTVPEVGGGKWEVGGGRWFYLLPPTSYLPPPTSHLRTASFDRSAMARELASRPFVYSTTTVLNLTDVRRTYGSTVAV